MHDPSNNNSDVVNISGGEGESSHPPLGNERINSAWNVTMK